MKILIVHNQLWAHYKAIIFNELQKIITQNKNDSLLVIQIASIEKSRKDLGALDHSIHQYPYKLLHEGLLENVSLTDRISGILKAIKEFKPDIVNLTGYYDFASWLILLYCKFNGIKTILSNETTSSDHERNGIKEYIKGLIIKQFDGYFNFGTSSENYILSLGINPLKMLVKRNCVDNKSLNDIYLKYFKRRIDQQQLHNLPTKNFIFVGRLIEYKNLYQFLEAFNSAQQKTVEKWGVIILGDGDLKTDLQLFVHQKHIENISFHSGVSWQQVPEYLALSDVLVLPSYSEPWGLVVNEAMACGLPVIVSERCGCAIDLVKNGENGFTFDPKNPEELTILLLKFMNLEVDSEKMGLVSKNIIQEYSPENVALEMYSGFQKTFQK
jgi:glycosyltransferase involved in cell wall biosynthesis